MFDALNRATAAVFGEPAVWTRAGQPPVTVSGIFDSRYYEVPGPDGSAPMTALVTTLTVRAADAPSARREDTVTVRSVQYRIMDIRPDGQGMTTWGLERA